MLISVTKFEAARRQLNTAIRLMFGGVDPIAVHTLLGAASVLLSDLAELHDPTDRWEAWAQRANNISEKAYFHVARAAQNFLKHADRDAGATLELHLSDTDALAFGAVMNVQLFDSLSIEESVLQLWYIASYDPEGDGCGDLFHTAVSIFGDLRHVDHPVRLKRAHDILLRETLARTGSPQSSAK